MAYIESKDRNPFGEDFDETILEDSGRDSTWLEGYSDKRIERQLAIRRGDKVEPLPNRYHLARAKTFDGQRADGQRIFHWRSRKGYKPVEWNEETFKELGINPSSNPAFYKGEDGLVYNGSNMLMVADKAVAAANWHKLQDDQAQMQAAAANRMQAAGEAYAAATGGPDPTFAIVEDSKGRRIADQPTRQKKSKK
jgi:hypothetical protein